MRKALLGGAGVIAAFGVAAAHRALGQDTADLPSAPQPYTGLATPVSYTHLTLPTKRIV